MDRRRRTGQRGEEIAVSYLIAKGYKIVRRNWRCQIGEIDIIVEDDDSLVFVEVRTRHGKHFGSPEESVTPAKQTRLIELAHTFLQETESLSRAWRIDVVAVRLGAGLAQVNHIENAVGW